MAAAVRPTNYHGHQTREQNMNRRSFLKTAGVLASAAGVMTRENLTLQAADVSKGAPYAEKPVGSYFPNRRTRISDCERFRL